jgi:predicted metal-dependent phosphotriesterase family hydrolase
LRWAAARCGCRATSAAPSTASSRAADDPHRPRGHPTISRATGVHVVAATGRHQPVHYTGADTLPDDDGPSLANHRTDWRLFDLLLGMAEAGQLGQIMLGADTTTRSATWVAGGGPGMRGLLETTGARVRRELGADAADQIYVRNPARAFSVRAPATRRPAAAA